MENYDVAVVRCKTYNVEAVKPALEEALNAVNGLDFVKPGMKIIIKPNLVSFKKPDAAATTAAVGTVHCWLCIQLMRFRRIHYGCGVCRQRTDL